MLLSPNTGCIQYRLCWYDMACMTVKLMVSHSPHPLQVCHWLQQWIYFVGNTITALQNLSAPSVGSRTREIHRPKQTLKQRQCGNQASCGWSLSSRQCLLLLLQESTEHTPLHMACSAWGWCTLARQVLRVTPSLLPPYSVIATSSLPEA